MSYEQDGWRFTLPAAISKAKTTTEKIVGMVNEMDEVGREEVLGILVRKYIMDYGRTKYNTSDLDREVSREKEFLDDVNSGFLPGLDNGCNALAYWDTAAKAIVKFLVENEFVSEVWGQGSNVNVAKVAIVRTFGLRIDMMMYKPAQWDGSGRNTSMLPEALHKAKWPVQIKK